MTSLHEGYSKQNISPLALRLRSFLKFVIDLALILLIVTLGKSAIAEPYYVPSGSMEPTLKIGDELLATKYNYGYSMASLPLFLQFRFRRALACLVRFRGMARWLCFAHPPIHRKSG
jgi:signal peptidase I